VAAQERVTDWNQVLQISQWHRLHTVLFKMLRENPSHVSADVMPQLEAGYRANAARNMKLTSLLFRLLGAFNEANIPVLVIKGLALAAPLFGDVAMRRSGDVDILIHPDDVPRAQDLVCAMESCSTSALSPFRLKVLMRTDNEMKLYLSDELVELQWGLAPMLSLYPAGWEDLYGEAENVSMAGRGVPTLGTLEMLPYLCFHGTKHLWYRLFWLLDVAAWMQWKQCWPWQAMLGRAQDREQSRSILLGLALSRHLFGSDMPDGVMEIFHNLPYLAKKVHFLRDRMMPKPGVPYEADVSDFLWWKNIYWMNPEWYKWVGITHRYLFQPTLKDLDAVKLPESLFPLYRVLRPMRLGASAIKSMVGK